METQQCWHLLALVAYSLKPVKLLGPCKRTQHCWPTTPNNIGSCWHLLGPFAWAFKVFKRSQHVGQCCFYGKTEGSLGLIFTPKLFLSRSSAIMALDECRRWKTRKCIAIAIVLCHLENTPSHINKNKELLSNVDGNVNENVTKQ